jgi:hypothetical protein
MKSGGRASEIYVKIALIFPARESQHLSVVWTPSVPLNRLVNPGRICYILIRR